MRHQVKFSQIINFTKASADRLAVKKLEAALILQIHYFISTLH